MNAEVAARGIRAIFKPTRRARWMTVVAAGVIASISLVLLFLLTQATDNRLLYERFYTVLVRLNIAAAGLLLLVILWVGWRLWLRWRQRKFGSQLLVKLAAIFALVGCVPGVLIYVVSYQFVSRSIESWFDVEVEGALDAGLNLGVASLDALRNDLANKTREASNSLAAAGDTLAGLSLERLREQLSANDAVLWSASGHLISSAGKSRYDLNPDKPTVAQLRQLRSERSVTVIEGLDDLTGTTVTSAEPRIKALVWIAPGGFGLPSEARVLQVAQPLPPSLVANAVAVQAANRAYKERALGRDNLRRMYIGTLTLSLFLAVFGAVLLAVLLGNQLVRPLLVLAEGVRQVAAGDLRPKAALTGRDELGGLTRAFADMTQQLSDARAALDQSMEEVNAARTNLQTILDNLTAGVIVLDEAGLIVSSNPGATRILRVPLAAYEGKPFASVPSIEEFAAQVERQFNAFISEKSQHALDHWQQAFELHAQGTGLSLNALNLVARGAQMPDGARLLVFDDISEIVSAQRAKAWGEVARRLAHEIKNPLTPIQLSAERLAMKLDGKVPAAEQTVLNKSVKTIIDQVDAMKRLVNEFRDYARLPAAELKPIALNQVILDVLQLYNHDKSPQAVVAELDEDCPLVPADTEQMRQVIHNLLQNAQDATETAGRADAEHPVCIRTQWQPKSGRVRMVVEDHGTGFPDPILRRAFEPYITTKAKGTGLGLAVVKKIVEDHDARIDISNRVVDGTVVGAKVSLSFAIGGGAGMSQF